MKLRKNCRGATIAETCAGLLVVIPVALALIDFGAMILAQIANDGLAKHCARAAADQATFPDSQSAADVVFANFNDTFIVQKIAPCVTTDISVAGSYNTVRCETTVNCRLPVPLPVLNIANTQFKTFAVEPVVGAF